MEITDTLAADLAILCEALDDAEADITESLRRLAADAKAAVRSYLGLTLVGGTPTFPLELNVMDSAAAAVDVVSSLLMPLHDDAHDDAVPSLSVIMYAGAAGAFIDLAADLSWLTGRRLTDFALDRHLSLPARPDTAGSLHATSVINQAIGVLVGQGHTPEQAEAEIAVRAAAAGHSRSHAADVILGNVSRDDTGSPRSEP